MFAPDIKQYVEERGLLFDPFKLPFPCALDNDELERSILSFDETSFRSKTDAFFIEHALKDDGHASERVVQIIDDFIQGK